VNGPNHPLDGRLRSYYRGLVHWVPWATGYDPTNMDPTQFLLVANSWGTMYSIPDTVPPHLDKGGDHHLKRMKPGNESYRSFLSHLKQLWASRILPPISSI
jgi:hypothetical protein